MHPEKIGPITCKEEVRHIPDRSARIAASIIFELYPGEVQEIGYESEYYEFIHAGKVEGTRPDLNVKLWEDPGFTQEATFSDKKKYIQTLHSLPIWLGNSDVVLNNKGNIDLLPIIKENDRKSKQKRVMENVAPEIDYRVWYGTDLTVLRKVAKRKREGKAV